MCFAYANKLKLLHAHQIQMGKDKILSEYDFTICFSQSNQINLEDLNYMNLPRIKILSFFLFTITFVVLIYC